MGRGTGSPSGERTVLPPRKETPMGFDRALLPSSLLLAALLAPGLPAQEPDEAALRTGRDKKLASEFLKKAEWNLDFDKARAEAKKTGKILFAYFTRSYAP